MPWLGRGSPPPLWGAAGKAGYALSCVAAALVLAISGFSYFVVRDVSSIGGSNAVSGSASTGAMNILLMGLESRTYWSGQPLPHSLTNAMHIGSIGGQDATNTLIVLHIFAGGRKAVGFSIPRDDWVTFPKAYDGQTQGKIDQAYGFALAEKEQSLAGKGLTQGAGRLPGQRGGPRAEIATVQKLTGSQDRPLRRAEPARLLRARQGPRRRHVCLNEENGALRHLPDATPAPMAEGRLLAPGRGSVAGVRQGAGQPDQRRSRPHPPPAGRRRLRAAGSSASGRAHRPGQVSSLLSVAKQYLVTDRGWNLLDFLPRCAA